MTQPTFAIPCLYGLTARKGTRTKKVQFGDGYEQVAIQWKLHQLLIPLPLLLILN